jgi:hypothetical protein
MTRARAVTVAAAIGLLLAACGTQASSTPQPTTSVSTTSTTAGTQAASGTVSPTDKPLCTLIGTYLDGAGGVGSASSLSEARKQIATWVDGISRMAQTSPATLKQATKATHTDVLALQRWEDTKATLKEVNGNKVPPSLAKVYADLIKQSKVIVKWLDAHCK